MKTKSFILTGVLAVALLVALTFGIAFTSNSATVFAKEDSGEYSCDVSLDDLAIGVDISNYSTLANDKALALNIEGFGKITFNKEAVATFNANETMEVLKLNVTDVTDENKADVAKDIKTNNPVKLLEISLTTNAVDGENVAFGNKGRATITFGFDNEVSKYKRVIVNYENNGKATGMNATYDAENKEVSFTTSHFSTFAVAIGDSTNSSIVVLVLILFVVLITLGFVAYFFIFRRR